MDGSPDSIFWESATRPLVLLLVSGLFIAVLYVYYKIAYEPYQLFKLLGVKGPTPRVFLGNTLLFKTMGEEKMFEHLYHAYGSISGFYLGTKPYLVVADPHILQDIMTKEADCFTDMEVDEHFTHTQTHRLPYSLLPTSRKEWKRMCSIFGSAFIPSKMKMLIRLLQESRKTLIGVLKDAVADPEESIDIWRLYCSITVEMMCSLVGEKVKIQAGEESKLSRSIQSFFAHRQERSKRDIIFKCIIRKCPFTKKILKYFSRRIRAQTNFEEIVKAVAKLLQVQHRQEQPHQEQGCMKKNFLQMLIEASNIARSTKKNISHAQVVSFCVTFLLTSYDTITSTLAYTSYLLTLYPSVQAKLRSEIDSYYKKTPAASVYDVSEGIEYLDMIIQESLRMHPPTSKIYRTCVRTCELRGLTIFPGIRVVIPIDLICHLPEHWEEPEEFKPERFATKQKESPSKFPLTFGIGESPQNCIGMRFALITVKILLIEILKNYRFITAPDTEVPLETTTMKRPANGIHVKIRKYIRYTQSFV